MNYIVPALMFMTLGIVIFVAIAAFAWFMRKRSNRHPMRHQRERNYDEMQRGVPPEG